MIVALPIADRGDASILPFLFRFTLIPLGECIDWRIVADPIRSVQAFQQIPHRRVFRSIAQQNDCISFAKGFHETGCPAFGQICPTKVCTADNIAGCHTHFRFAEASMQVNDPLYSSEEKTSELQSVMS